MFSKGLRLSNVIATVTRKDTWKLNCYGRHVCSEIDKVLGINILKEHPLKNILVHDCRFGVSLVNCPDPD